MAKTPSPRPSFPALALAVLEARYRVLIDRAGARLPTPVERAELVALNDAITELLPARNELAPAP